MASGSDTNDDLYYLQPDFDLNSLTVPRLRSILVNHDVPYPASAKKSQLVAILESDVLPKAKKLLRERDRVRRTSRGITNMPNHNDVGGNVEEEIETIDRRQRTTPIRPSGKKSRKSEAYHTPHTPHYDDVVTPTAIKSDYTTETVFTDDNPFQGGSSPLDTPQARAVSSEQRRKSGMRRSSETEERRKRRSDLRMPIKVKQEDDIQVPTRSTFDVPISKLKMMPKFEESSDFGAGEEFTPDEQLALDQEEAYNGRRTSILRGQRQTQGGTGTFLSWFVILTLLSGFGLWWRKEKLDIGYCGVGKAHWSLEDTNVPSWANVIEPQCEICPQHAFCYPNFEAGCEQGFVLKPHPLSLGGIIPLPPTCEADGEKARRIKVVADKAVEELRTQRAKFECGETTKETNEVVSTPEVTATELQAKVGNLRRKGMSDEEFEDLWKGALGEITGREEIVVSTGPSSDSDFRLTSTSLAKLSFSCSIRRHLRLSILAYRLPILVLVLLLLFATYIRSRILAGRSDAARVPSLVGMTLDRLATQAALHARGEALEPWISVGQLRDDVLRDELRGSRREKLWKRVRAIVEGNANVRASVREGRGGDVSRVWEWIGGVSGVVNEWDSANRRESSKVKFSLSPSSEGVAVHSPEPGSRRESKKWDEGRAIY
ncbi:sister chromatid separation protein [Arthroderma uncinatum]|uniref:sister chromatid separation protein n=1 Tax=Arthroderma uncinatum TaxID=74035 RepID=UPI00144AC05A|nr:sister chromatid separation protein [Arthroderma uncinatum]KAF3492309.1 sister chromatid separation protein [Arthroderma uncinatum]